MKDIIKSKNGIAFTTSQKVAFDFNKSHKHVLEKIDNILSNRVVGISTMKKYFIESSFKNDQNREYRMFEITRDGFALLGMSFTGEKALKFKLMYISAFNSMENELKDIYTSRKIGVETRKVLTAEVVDSGENERMHGHGISNYTKLAYKLAGINYIKQSKDEKDFRDTLCKEEIERVDNIESMMKALIKTGKIYGEIKKDMETIFIT